MLILLLIVHYLIVHVYSVLLAPVWRWFWLSLIWRSLLLLRYVLVRCSTNLLQHFLELFHLLFYGINFLASKGLSQCHDGFRQLLRLVFRNFRCQLFLKPLCTVDRIIGLVTDLNLFFPLLICRCELFGLLNHLLYLIFGKLRRSRYGDLLFSTCSQVLC